VHHRQAMVELRTTEGRTVHRWIVRMDFFEQRPSALP